MPWWHRVVTGFVLVGLELVVVGNFFIIFFGVGAILVGLLDLVGLEGPQWFQWLLFSCLSVVCLMLFRDPLLRRLGGVRTAGSEVDANPGEQAHATDEIAPGGVLAGSMRRLSAKSSRGGCHPSPQGGAGLPESRRCGPGAGGPGPSGRTRG